MTAAREAEPVGLPPALAPLGGLVGRVRREDLSRHLTPAEGGRPSAVLLVFAVGDAGAEVLLLQRAAGLRNHPGQVAFPGGSVDAGESLVECAVREAEEETGLDPAGVRVLGTLPSLYLPPSGYVVTPVLAWEAAPSPVAPGDPGEVSSVHRVSVRDLVDPAHRLRVRHPASGYVGPAFAVDGLLVWGFTAMLLSSVLRLAGWERPWDQEAEPVDAPAAPSAAGPAAAPPGPAA
ncbi:ADP-ribose pyrophosphatase YjhB (NUDIX family) [Motilibacter peucedani]|uniref:ADP-ribose pyrophosphatase YjhB (NUDIX family) n=1 Tax=Motilibacter peucedani TaxID=598650 RepID=A0A420XQ24_9ACTN|nr:CoA pyrophosphatase [Motilibacter peucedani]RKS75383.1 ADP-ribose pyrophosphatase YjhB (NUDIX family) [Motilibacter peucedani]